MPRRTLRKKARYAVRSMYPNRVLARLMSGGKHQTIGAWTRSYVTPPGPRTFRMADEVNLSDRQRLLPPSQRKGAAPRKAPAKKQSPYEAAKQIPARNRATAVKAAKKTAAAGKPKTTYKQGKDGKMQGSVNLGADLSLYKDVQAGRAVIQPGEPNRRRL
jgi:hypothetical protein